ncbi:unnamed protein product [Caenorhabditis sp. 36 PRJEB53466]|nr:unnamed protein product [Caenorhabditis sp. 36 PRJEB53466]
MNPSTCSLYIILFSLFIHVTSEALMSPIYEYLKDLCPSGQLPLTSSKTVKTCANLCPLGALCYRGICCVPNPQCRHPSYRMSAGFPCLPSVKNNCPDGAQCVASSQDGMYICCSSKSVGKGFSSSRLKPTRPSMPIKKDRSTSSLVPSDSSQICPKTHPIIAHDGKSLVLCKDCIQGVCAKFRTSNVEVCCQSSDDICGAGSQVLMDSLVPRDCSKKPCGKGYECSLTPSGLRVCCSLARCPGGSFARSVCAAGCLRNEKCVPIHDESWCCPAEISVKSELSLQSNSQFQCKDDGKGTGEKCDPTFPICAQGAVCELNLLENAHICCKRFSKSKLANRKTLLPPLYYTTTPPQITTTTQEPFPVDVVPNCQDPLARPLIENGLPYMCIHPGDTCLRAGFTCQESDIDDVFVCCTAQTNRLLPPQIPTFPLILTSTTASPKTTTSSEEIGPACPFSYMPSKPDNQEVQRCLTLFSLDCPFGYTCLPSSTTDSYLCCIRKPVI